MADIPQPHRNFDLLMQGFSGLGGLGQAYAQQGQNAPLHPALQKYLDKLLNGQSPEQTAAEAKSDPLWQEFENYIRQGGRQPIVAQQGVPDVGFQNGRPAVQAPGAVSPAGGPQGPVAQQGGLGAMTAPPSRDIGLQPGEESFRTVVVQAPPGQAGYSQSELAGGRPQPPNVMQGDAGSMLNMTNQAVSELGGTPNPLPREPVAQSPFTGPNAAMSMPQPRPQPAQAPAQGQAVPPRTLPAMSTATPSARPGGASRQYTERDLKQVQGVLPAVVAAQGRENVANINARSKADVEDKKQKVRSAIAMMRERGLDTHRAELAMQGIEKLDDQMQLAVLNLTGKLLMQKMQGESAENVAQLRRKGPENEKLKELRYKINSYNQTLAGIVRNPAWADDKKLKAQVDDIIKTRDAAERERSKILEDWPSDTKQPVQKQTVKGGFFEEDTETNPTLPNGVEYDEVRTSKKRGKREYLLNDVVVHSEDL